ncbi:nucleoside phosphorylase [Luteipulveratus flavus]|uniref:Uridine phosphorylase n=1 Tax=Luteipulveratus flavus TaxID=3031728 RepID=A0ABT6CCZ5_9MICO|nr:nucleoside phosphorylase [Luteipulveratus sp. YIM 133296]MDF8266267.1 nucleoside phosphorylase [Luteipulveratus sp. YIM 133296]
MAADERQIIPLLEYDASPQAFIEPVDVRQPVDVPRACVLSWFHDGIERLVGRLDGRQVVENRWEDGPHPLFEVDMEGRRVGLVPMPVSGAAAGSLVEELIALGCRSFAACGGAGSLRPDVTLGHLVVVTSALRDEGLSHHYLPPGRVVDADPAAVATLEATLTEHGVPYVAGRTWTTDAFFRETPAKIAARRDEDCVTVDMEAASIAAVARFRDVRLAQLLYGGDDLSGAAWDHRSWRTQHEVRDNMLALAMNAALRMEA